MTKITGAAVADKKLMLTGQGIPFADNDSFFGEK
jgi:hypothetical protein